MLQHLISKTFIMAEIQSNDGPKKPGVHKVKVVDPC